MCPLGRACLRPLCVYGGRVQAVGGKSEDVAACVDLWPAVIAGAGLLQLAFASSEDVFRFKTRKGEPLNPPFVTYVVPLVRVGRRHGIVGHHPV